MEGIKHPIPEKSAGYRPIRVYITEDELDEVIEGSKAFRSMKRSRFYAVVMLAGTRALLGKPSLNEAGSEL